MARSKTTGLFFWLTARGGGTVGGRTASEERVERERSLDMKWWGCSGVSRASCGWVCPCHVSPAWHFLLVDSGRFGTESRPESVQRVAEQKVG